MKNNNFPITITLHFPSGDPSSVCEACIEGYNAVAHKIPRLFLNDAFLRDRISKVGVYFLIGQINENFKVYVGEAEDLFKRLKEHDKDEKKNWFSDVIVFTSERNFLNKAKVKYLEHSFYASIKDVGRYTLDQTNPTKSTLSLSDEGVMLEFISKAKTIVLGLGYKMFEEIAIIEERDSAELLFSNYGTKKQRSGYRHSEGFVVRKGSYIRPNESTKLYPWVRDARKNNQSKIVDDYLVEDVLLNSPSLAINFCNGNVSSGNREWKTKDGVTLGELLDREGKE